MAVKGEKIERIIKTLNVLRRQYPSGGALEIGNPFAMLVAVSLSARTKDEQVLKLMPELMRKYPTPEKMSEARVQDLEKCIGTIGLFRQKAKNLQAMATMLVEDFGGVVPKTLSELVLLPGVGRKTASVILVAAFNIPAIAVDTHVFRIVNRLGWVRASSPEEMEKKLLNIVPGEHQATINHVFVPFGRALCIPGKPRCWDCPIADLCAFQAKNLEAPANADTIRSHIAENEARLEELKQDAIRRIGHYGDSRLA